MSAILEKTNPRGGARDARRAARSAPLPDSLRPVRPGMNGGAYKALSDADVVKIHNAALDALENIGLADAPDVHHQQQQVQHEAAKQRGRREALQPRQRQRRGQVQCRAHRCQQQRAARGERGGGGR